MGTNTSAITPMAGTGEIIVIIKLIFATVLLALTFWGSFEAAKRMTKQQTKKIATALVFTTLAGCALIVISILF